MNVSTTSVFNDQLSQLCIKNFPCGFGTWREDFQTVTTSLSQITTSTNQNVKNNIDYHYSVTLKDHDASKEKTEVLSEYVSSKFSPWTMDYSWSEEAKSLREISIVSPWVISHKMICMHFKTLRMVDKKITHIDKRISSFKNLEELTLSGNFITSIPSQNLPKNLRVLELCANVIFDISTLTSSPPPLQHLGLGLNQLIYLDDYITAQNWPELLSLDLSNNHLNDILDVVKNLATLPKLSNLVLQGNPIALVPAYRGFVIDSIRNLLILDDIRITADEKHYFKGIARRKEFVLDEVKLKFSVKSIKNLPIPEEIKAPEDFPEVPVIVRKYFVRFWYPMDTSLPEVVEEQDPVQSQGQLSDILEAAEPEAELLESLTVAEPAEETAAAAEVDAEAEAAPQPAPVVVEIRDSVDFIQLTAVNSESVQYSAEDAEMDWSETVTRDEPLAIRNFLRKSMTLEVVEEKSLLYPPDELPVPEDNEQKPSSGKKGKKEDKKKDDQPVKKDDKKNKKKKVDESQLVTYSTELNTVASLQLCLASFLAGETAVAEVLQCAELLSSSFDDVDLSASQDKRTKNKDEKKTKEKDSKTAKAGGKPPVKGKENEAEEDEEPAPPPPLEISVEVEMVQWKSVKDSIQPEEVAIAESVPS